MKNYLKTTTKIYTINDVASLLIVDGETIRKWIREDELNGIRIGAKKEGYIILDNDLQTFMDKHNKYKKIYALTCNKCVVESVSIYEFILNRLYGKISSKEFFTLSALMNSNNTTVCQLLDYIKSINNSSYDGIYCFLKCFLDKL